MKEERERIKRMLIDIYNTWVEKGDKAGDGRQLPIFQPERSIGDPRPVPGLS